MAKMLSSISCIVVVRDVPADEALLVAISKALTADFVDVEMIIIANDVSVEESIRLRQLVERLPDTLLVFVNDVIHDDIARLLGVDHAISDYVLFCTPLRSEVDALPEMIEAARAGNDLVVGEEIGAGITVQRNPVSGQLFRAFRFLHRVATGKPYEARPPMFRLMSRAAALFVGSRSEGEVLVRARALGNGFPATAVPVREEAVVPRRGMPLRIGAAKALRLLMTGSTLPMRVVSLLGLAGGVASLIYAFYVVLIYFLKAEVAPGWTTLSLQTSAMTFVFSIQFVFLAEYLVQILSASPSASRRNLVSRELRSSLTRRSGRLNVVDGQGQFHLGAPAIFSTSTEKA